MEKTITYITMCHNNEFLSFFLGESSRQLCKASTWSWVCITVSNSPNPSRVYIRLCKHGKRFLLLKSLPPRRSPEQFNWTNYIASAIIKSLLIFIIIIVWRSLRRSPNAFSAYGELETETETGTNIIYTRFMLNDSLEL